MRNRCSLISLGVVALWASTAMAEPDTFGLGTGRDGALTVTEPRTLINRYAQVKQPLAPGDTVLFVSSAEGFAAGDLIMILQTTGIVPEPARGETGPVSLSHDPVGRWELARVSAAGGQELTLAAPLLYSYAGAVTQVIRVPEYTDVKVAAGASLVAAPWDGSQGGLLAFLATGLIQNEGELLANGIGFRGGVVPEESMGFPGCATLPASVRSGEGRGEGISSLDFGMWATGLENASNGGGGGLCPKAGGGGGGNGASGGRGGDSWTYGDSARDIGGKGGAGLAYSLRDHLTLGGGGGQGYGGGLHSQGGAGGGAIFVRGYRLAGSGAILADGSPGEDARQGGAGGGGAGGSISLRVVDSAECGLIAARGGHGGSSSAETAEYAGPGGGGGGGQVLYAVAKTGSCPVSVEAGLAGELTGSASGIVTGAQPTAIQRSAHRGIIMRLEAGAEKNLACTLAAPSISAPTDGQSINTSRPEFSGVVLGYGNNDKVKVNIGSSASGTVAAVGIGSPRVWTYTPSAPLSNQTYTVTVVGVCGGTEESSNKTVINITIDTEVPQIGWAEPMPSDPLYGDSATFRFTVGNEDRPVTYKCELNDSTVGLPDSPASCGAGRRGEVISYTVRNLAERSHTFEVAAVDAAGNPTNGSLRYLWTVTLTPNVNITRGPARYTNLRDAVFEFASAAPTSTFKCKLNSAAWADCNSPHFYPSLTDNAYTFQVKALANGRESLTASYSWDVDTSPPNARLTGTPTNPSNVSRPVFTFGVEPAEAGLQFDCVLDSVTYSNCMSPWTVPAGLSSGSHTFAVIARDRAGNVAPSTTPYPWVVDTEAPDTRLILTPRTPTNPSNDPQPEFTFVAEPEEPGAVFDCALDAEDYPNCVSPWTVPIRLSHGNHTFTVKARDSLGNVDLSPAAYQWGLDLVGPNTNLIGPPNPSNNTTPTFSFSATEGGSTFKCRMDSNGFESCTSPWTSPALRDGNHTFEVKATDPLGNEAAIPTRHFWEVDTVAPTISIQSAPQHATRDRTAVFVFESSSDLDHYECDRSDDSRLFERCEQLVNISDLANGRFTILNLRDGEYWLTVRAVDKAGNTSSEIRYDWRVDTELTNVTLEEPANGSQVGTPRPIFKGTAEPGATVWVVVKDSQGLETTEGPGTAQNDGSWSLMCSKYLPNGVTSAIAEAVDKAQNRKQTARISFRVDQEPPDTEIRLAPLSPDNRKRSSFAIRSDEDVYQVVVVLDGILITPDIDARNCDDEDEVRRCFELALNTMGTKEVERKHTVEIRAKDRSGNVDPTPATYTWDVVITPPPAPHIKEPSAGAVISELIPTIQGSALPRDEVACDLVGSSSDGGSGGPVDGGSASPRIGITKADSKTGEWDLRPSRELVEGLNTLRCIVLEDAAGNAGEEATTVTFRVVPLKPKAQAIGGGLGCAASGGSLGVTLLGLLWGAIWTSRRRRR